MKKLLTKLLKLFGLYKPRDIDANIQAAAVITGVEASPVWGSCSGATRDCDGFREILERTTDNYEITILKNEQATVSKWKKAVAEAVKKPLAIIFYSGHGGADKTHALGNGSDEDDGVDEFLCLYDKPLVDNEIWNIISKSNGKVFLIFDCCHSGTMFRSADEEDVPQEEPITFDFDKFIMTDRDGNTDESSTPNITCWSACADDTVAKGSVLGGVFTNTLKRIFSNGDTYNNVWKKLISDRSLTRIEKIQIHEIGESFKDNLFCR